MAKKRLRPLADDEMTEAQRRVAEAVLSGPRGGLRGPFPALLRKPKLAECARRLSDCIRYDNVLPPPLRELAILIVARHWDAHYAWYAHSTIALDEGLGPAIVDAIAEGEEPDGLGVDEKIVYDFSRELLNKNDLGDATYDAALARFGEAGVVDLTATIGFYCLVAVTLNMLREEVPDDGKRLPDIEPR
ncbi:MAG: carboxymuconolactone decarboxylase family protein [Proteobacteria bacterium]|nr:carboxymuconolactone decarboxylase family protein [Pseudomonadota bacterium]MCH8096905.1 carboxymuconolactone decarboxylase family protein [Pseudomonadota bacterium]